MHVTESAHVKYVQVPEKHTIINSIHALILRVAAKGGMQFVTQEVDENPVLSVREREKSSHTVRKKCPEPDATEPVNARNAMEEVR